MIVSLPGSTRAPNGPYSYKNPYSKSLHLGQGALELQMNHFYKRILVQNYDIWALTDTTMNVLSGSLYLLSGACERAFGAPGCPLEAIGLQIYNFHTRSIMQNPCILRESTRAPNGFVKLKFYTLKHFWFSSSRNIIRAWQQERPLRLKPIRANLGFCPWDLLSHDCRSALRES